jgi:hypothetical protein
MTVALPGYARPTLEPIGDEDILIGSPDALTWRPLGGYISREIEFDWRVPGFAVIQIKGTHPLAPYLMQCRRKVIHLRTSENGIMWNGRVMKARAFGRPGQEVVTITAVDYKYWLKTGLAWVNNQLPPEVQINLTGKQDVRVGSFDQISKSYAASIFTRLRKPVYAALPIRWDMPDLPDLDDIDTLDDLLDLIADFTDEACVWQARFPPLDELMKQDLDRLERGIGLDLWSPVDGPSPHVFNTTSLSQLQSVIDYTSDNFLNFTNPGNILGLADPTTWGKMTRAGYVFDTLVKEDKTHMQWRADGTQIEHIDRTSEHMTAHRIVVGGKAPEILNQVIEWGANFAIQLLLNAIAPGLGLGMVVGDLFDNIFFAYQQFWDPDVESDPDLGEHAFGEAFGDNTAAWSANSATIGLAELKKHGGSDAVTITVTNGGPDGRGFRFGVDDATGKTFKVGDIMQIYHLGTIVEQYVSNVKVKTDRNGRKVYAITLGDAETAQDGWERVIGRVNTLFGTARGVANSL